LCAPMLQASFNPLHCGAVVASCAWMRVDGEPEIVSIPFIAGQWSLLGSSPVSATFWRTGLNPLHCGAVVASERGDPAMHGVAVRSQSPSLRGSGRFESAWELDEVHALVSQSPSLRGSGRFASTSCGTLTSRHSFQSPSLRGSGRFLGVRLSLAWGTRVVSIPFIAGQWSLHRWTARRRLAPPAFQSPSLRGSGRFSWRLKATG